MTATAGAPQEPIQKPDEAPEFYHSRIGSGDTPSRAEADKVIDEIATELIG